MTLLEHRDAALVFWRVRINETAFRISSSDACATTVFCREHIIPVRTFQPSALVNTCAALFFNNILS